MLPSEPSEFIGLVIEGQPQRARGHPTRTAEFSGRGAATGGLRDSHRTGRTLKLIGMPSSRPHWHSLFLSLPNPPDAAAAPRRKSPTGRGRGGPCPARGSGRRIHQPASAASAFREYQQCSYRYLQDLAGAQIAPARGHPSPGLEPPESGSWVVSSSRGAHRAQEMMTAEPGVSMPGLIAGGTQVGLAGARIDVCTAIRYICS